MLPIFSFVLMWLGALNWFFISAFQYDFVAGFFGTQSSLFSRVIYFVIGMAGFYFLIYLLKNKGKVNLFNKPFKWRKAKPEPTKVAVPVGVVEPVDELSEAEEIRPAPVYHSTAPQRAPEKAESGFKDFDETMYD